MMQEQCKAEAAYQHLFDHSIRQLRLCGTLKRNLQSRRTTSRL